MTEINSKRKMYELLRRGDLGNTVQVWDTFTELRSSEFQGKVRIRFRQPSINNVLNVSTGNIVEWMDSLNLQGIDYNNDLVFYEAPRDESLLLQGELQMIPGGLYMRYNYCREHMKTGFTRQEKHSLGLETNLILSQRCSQNCIDQLHYLLNKYDGHIVEFASYGRCQGIYNEDYLIYECRRY